MKKNDLKKDGKQSYEKLPIGKVFLYKRAYWIKLENQQAGCVSLYQQNDENYLGQLISISNNITVHGISYIEIG